MPLTHGIRIVSRRARLPTYVILSEGGFAPQSKDLKRIAHHQRVIPHEHSRSFDSAIAPLRMTYRGVSPH
jgi:hypothetical protein